MSNVFYVIIIAILAFSKYVHSQRFVGDECSLQSSGNPGVCKLMKDCPQAVKDLREQNRRPQRCGFLREQPIVCCETENKQPEREPGTISKRKCREYARYVFETRRSPVNRINAPQVTRNECGHKVVKLIVGGKPAERKEFPHMAAIGYQPNPDEDVKWYCGGTIISNKFVLTAAHCLNSYDLGPAKFVKLGVTDLDSNSHLQEKRVAERIPHPEYRSSSHYHDIGLLRLETPAKLNPYARPACLHLNHEIDAEKAIATGWGQTQWGGSGSQKLLKVTIDLFDHAFCNSSYKNQINRRLAKGIDDEIQFCAGSLDEEKDTCQGDSGGPLQIYYLSPQIKCMYDIIGVTSFGKACSGNPGVYVRVSHYIKWIEDIVWPQ